MTNVYDYVIVGAGSAGAILASRLSEDPSVSVLLLESGPVDNSPWIHMPKGFVKLMLNESHRWLYPIAPSGSNGRADAWMGGRMLGGSSSINGMQYARGLPQDYDAWEAIGNRGWGWADMLPVFRAMEGHALGEAEARGGSGPLKLQVFPDRLPAIEAIIEALGQSGVPRVDDMNAAVLRAAGYSVSNIHGGRRGGSAQTLLRQARGRRNLTVRTGCHVHRIEFDGARATGVACREAGVERRYSATRDLVLSAGVVNSPRILQLSGVGDGAHLQTLGIDVVKDLPGVGRNFRDQRYLDFRFRVREARLSTNREYSGWRLARNLLRYALARSGPLAWPPAEGAAFFTAEGTSGPPDSHLILQSFTMSPSHWTGGIRLESEPGITIIASQSRPFSTGAVTIRSRDPEAAPDISLNALSDPRDRTIAVNLFRRVRALAATPPLAEIIACELQPGPNCEDDNEIVAAFQNFGTGAMHAVGTCQMGRGPDAVVDERLRVRGLAGLRIADCSIMPHNCSGAGGTSGPAMAVGWRAAEIISEDRRAEG